MLEVCDSGRNPCTRCSTMRCGGLWRESPSCMAARQVVAPLDPRIHFALVCGAKSCPPIKVYTAEALEEGLEAAAASFCESAGPRYRLSDPSPDLPASAPAVPSCPCAGTSHARSFSHVLQRRTHSSCSLSYVSRKNDEIRLRRTGLPLAQVR